MKIAIVTPYRYYSGGVESVNEIVKILLESAGHKVFFCTADNINLSIFDKLIVKFLGLPYITSKRFNHTKEKFDLVIANGEFAFGIRHPRVINVFHGTYKGLRDSLKDKITKKEFIHYSLKSYVQKIATKGKYVVTVSEFVKDILIKDGIKVDQVITNSIDAEIFKPFHTIKNNKYLFVGSYDYYSKGFDVLEKLADIGFQIDCVTNKKESSKLGFIENVENPKMVKIYNKYKIFIFPSRFEGLGLAPLEAMACGLPIVMSNVGVGVQLKKIIPEFVVDNYDEQNYVKKIRHIENNYEVFSKKARLYIEKYHSFEAYKNKWLKLVEGMVND